MYSILIRCVSQNRDQLTVKQHWILMNRTFVFIHNYDVQMEYALKTNVKEVKICVYKGINCHIQRLQRFHMYF